MHSFRMANTEIRWISRWPQLAQLDKDQPQSRWPISSLRHRIHIKRCTYFLHCEEVYRCSEARNLSCASVLPYWKSRVEVLSILKRRKSAHSRYAAINIEKRAERSFETKIEVSARVNEVSMALDGDSNRRKVDRLPWNYLQWWTYNTAWSNYVD